MNRISDTCFVNNIISENAQSTNVILGKFNEQEISTRNRCHLFKQGQHVRSTFNRQTDGQRVNGLVSLFQPTHSVQNYQPVTKPTHTDQQLSQPNNQNTWKYDMRVTHNEVCGQTYKQLCNATSPQSFYAVRKVQQPILSRNCSNQ